MKHVLAALALLSMAAAADARCKHSRDIERFIDAADVSSLELTARAGSLRIRPADGNAIRLDARLCSTDEDALVMMDVVHAVDGDRLSLDVVIPWDSPDFDPDGASIDLQLAVPAGLPIDAQDSSGDIDVHGVALRSLRDSSGGIRIRDGRSALTLEDSSGEIDIQALAGDLVLSDSSGEIEVHGVRGGVHIRHDSSGGIDLRDIHGDVSIDRDSSGGIRVEAVKGGVRIGADSSGGIELFNIAKDVVIGSDGSGEIRVRDVGGDFSVRDKARGPIDAQAVAGEISLP